MSGAVTILTRPAGADVRLGTTIVAARAGYPEALLRRTSFQGSFAFEIRHLCRAAFQLGQDHQGTERKGDTHGLADPAVTENITKVTRPSRIATPDED